MQKLPPVPPQITDIQYLVITHIGKTTSVSFVHPHPSTKLLPPPSYTTGLDGSTFLTSRRQANRLSPSPDSLPKDQRMIQAWFLLAATMRHTRSRKASRHEGSALNLPSGTFRPRVMTHNHRRLENNSEYTTWRGRGDLRESRWCE